MAGWTYIPLADLDRWQRTAVWIELYTAWNERRIAIGQSAVTVPSAGFKIQDKNAIQDIQAWIETYASSFVATIDSSLNPVTDYDGADSIEMWDWTKLKTRVLSGNSSWSRKSGSTVSYGQLEKGYWATYIKPINEIYLILKELKWTYGTYMSEINTISYVDTAETQKDGNGAWNTWSQSKTLAESDYASNSPVCGGSAYKYTYGTGWNHPEMYEVYFYAEIGNAVAYVKASNIPSGLAKSVDFYFIGKLPTIGNTCTYETFDNESASFLKEGKESKYSTSPLLGASDTETNTYPVGDVSLSLPSTWCSEPFGTGDNLETSKRGWKIGTPEAIIRWNVTDGFEYV